jgi:MYXO-CTERM domain-containing protein
MKPKGLAKNLLGTSALTAAIVVSFTSLSANAADKTWVGGTAGDLQTWNTATNWSGATTPVNADRIIINTTTGADFPVITSANAAAFKPGDVTLGSASGQTGRLDIQSGTLVQNVIGATGNWFFVGGALSNVAGGTGTLNIADTTVTGQSNLSTFGQGSGGLTIGKLWVGGRDGTGGTGTGTVNINTTGVIDLQSTGSGLAASLIVASQGGTGTVNFDNGTIQAANATMIGRIAGTGNFNMSGGTLNTAGLQLAVSTAATNTAQGTMTVTGGTVTSTQDVVVGLGGNTTAKGTLTIAGGTFNVGTTAEKWLKVGAFDAVTGELNINSGILNLNSNTDIRFNTNGGTGTSVINQNGGSVVSYSNNGVTLGGNTVLDMKNAGTTGSNTYNLNGGTLAISQVMSTVNNGSRTFNFNGGTLKVASNANAATFFNLGTGTTRANVRNGGAIIDTNGIDVTMAQGLAHSDIGGDNAIDGGLTKIGAGKLTLSGTNTYTGVTNINVGTLALASTGSLTSTQITTASGATFDVSAVSGYSVGSGVTLTNNGTVNGGFTVAAGGTLNGSGTFGGAVTVDGALNPGNSPGSQTYAGGLTLGAASTTTMEIAGSGGVAGTDFDFIDVTGGTLTNDGSLAIVDFGAYDLSAQTGTYNLFDFVTGAGDFDVVTVDGNSLTFNGGTDEWNSTVGDVTYNFAEGTGVLSVTVVPEPTAALLGGLGMLGLLRRRRVA